MASLKQTTYLREQFGEEGKLTIYYIDIRAIDRIDDFHQKIQGDENVHFVKSKVASITLDPETNNPILNDGGGLLRSIG